MARLEDSVPVNGQATRDGAGDTDAALCFPAEVLEGTLVVLQVRLELFEAPAVVVLLRVYSYEGLRE